MKKLSLEALSRIPERLADYCDANGYVFLDVPVSESDPTWTELTPEQRASVRPLTKTDERAWDAWHSKGKAAPSVVHLCEPCATARIGSDCRNEERLCPGILNGKCHDCGTFIGERGWGEPPAAERVPYFVQWQAWFDERGAADAP